jgi:hypothetical protein
MGFITKLDISTSCDFGSQMTQYASMVAISKKTGLDILFVKEYVEQRWGFPLGEPFKTPITVLPITDIDNLDIYSIDVDSTQAIDKRLFHLDSNCNYNLNGLFNTYDIFHPLREELTDIFTFNDEIKEFCLDYISQTKQENEILVSIHFRRGDYLQVSSLNLSLEYYQEAVNKIQSLFPNQKIKYLIFSNGMEWVKENFKLDNCVYVEGLDRFKDMCLMTLCDHNIIANSTFSWWGAYLNQNLNKKVVCPYNYLNYIPLNDIINGKYFPSEWISINKN